MPSLLKEWLDFELSTDINNQMTKYTLNKAADMNTWDITYGFETLYNASKGWEFSTDASYNTYKGYSAGYGDPEFIWNAGVSKHVKAVTFSLKAMDILNQRKALQRTTSDEYMLDVYHNVMGRYILFGISFNFGKMNAKNNQQAQNAMWNMMF